MSAGIRGPNYSQRRAEWEALQVRLEETDREAARKRDAEILERNRAYIRKMWGMDEPEEY